MSIGTRAGRRGMSPVRTLAVCGVLLAVMSGCDWLIPLAFLGEHKEKIPPEYDKLAGRKVAIVIWAAQETLFDYPHVRMELGLHIGDKLAAKLDDVRVVDGRKIEDYIQRNLLNPIDPEQIAHQFNCSTVVYLELLEFQIRDPEAPDFLRGTISASVTVLDLRVDPDEAKRYELEDVNALYPKDYPLLFNATNAVIVRKEAYEMFAEMVARKFYNYEVDM